MRQKSYRVMFVQWEDAAAKSEWMDEERCLQRCIVKSVGILTYEDKHKIELSVGIDPYHSKICTVEIPRGCILKKKTLSHLKPWSE